MTFSLIGKFTYGFSVTPGPPPSETTLPWMVSAVEVHRQRLVGEDASCPPCRLVGLPCRTGGTGGPGIAPRAAAEREDRALADEHVTRDLHGAEGERVETGPPGERQVAPDGQGRATAAT